VVRYWWRRTATRSSSMTLPRSWRLPSRLVILALLLARLAGLGRSRRWCRGDGPPRSAAKKLQPYLVHPCPRVEPDRLCGAAGPRRGTHGLPGEVPIAAKAYGG
jgi:hypothetical protein